MLHAYSLTKNCKTLYYIIEPLTPENLAIITTNLNLIGIHDIAFNLYFQQLRISLHKEMSSNIVDLTLSACGCRKIEAFIPPEVASWQNNASIKKQIKRP